MKEDEDYDYENYILDDEDEDTGPDYYVCFCCSYSCLKRPAWGGQCPRCGTHMEEEYF